MGLLKKLSKSLSGKSSSKEKVLSRAREAQLNEVTGNQPQSRSPVHGYYQGQSGIAQSQQPSPRPSSQAELQPSPQTVPSEAPPVRRPQPVQPDRPKPQKMDRKSQNPAGSVQLEFVRRQTVPEGGAPAQQPRNNDQYGDKYINGSPFLSFKDSKQQRAISETPEASLDPVSIREVPLTDKKKPKTSLDGDKPARIFQRPRLEQRTKSQSRSASIDEHGPSSSTVDTPFISTQPSPATALTIIIDPSLNAAKASSKNVMNDIAIGVLNLLRPLASTDTISIFGCDEASSGLFTFPADKSSYPQILDLVCKLHSQPLGRSPKLFDAIVMVIEELTCMSSECLKPLVIMTDYQPKQALGSSFEAQHALLWSAAQHLYPIFVSVWDQDLYSDIRVKTSKEVHIEMLGSQEISAAFMVILSHLRGMIKDHKVELETKKQRELSSVVYESHASLPLSNAHSIRDPRLDSVESQPEGDSILQGLPSPDITDRRPQQSPHTPDEQHQHSPRRSSLSSWDQRTSEFDSTANYASSSDGLTARDNVSLTDYPHEIPKDRSTEAEIEKGKPTSPKQVASSDSGEFKGFKGPAQHQAEQNPLFLDQSESEYGSVRVEEDDAVLTEVPWGSIDLRDPNSYFKPHSQLAFDSAPV